MSSVSDRYAEDDFQDYLEDLIAQGELEGAALGVARQAADRGVSSLSAKQRYVFDTYVVAEHAVGSCSRCSISIPWCEMLFALENRNMCSWCIHMVEKDSDDN